MDVDVTQSIVQTALRAFLLDVLPAGIPVVAGQDNRVPEPQPQNFVLFFPTTRTRLSTNVHEIQDAKFTGSITGQTLTITHVFSGTLTVGRRLFGVGLAEGTVITALGTGLGEEGTYFVDPSQDVASETISGGRESVTQSTEIAMQVEVHGPASADNSQVITTLFRDPYGVDFFEALGTGVTPLYADDPKQLPFVNAEGQYENRWVIDARLQVKPAVEIAQTYADVVEVGIVSVDASYPP